MTRKSFESHVQRAEAAVAGFCLVTSTVLIFFAALARSFSRPINWSLDISLFLFAWAVFLSADVAYRENKLVRLDFFVTALPGAVKTALQLLVYLVILAFLVALIYVGFVLTYRTRARAFQGIPSFSYSWITLSLPIGSILLARSTLEKMVALLARRDRPDVDTAG